MTRPELFQLGYVARAHGLTGEVAIKTFDPASEVLFDVPSVVLRPKAGGERTVEIESIRPANDVLLLTFVGVETRTEAEALIGSTVLVPRGALEPPAEGEFFQGDLIGLLAVDPAGVELGRVEEVWNTGPVPNLVIRGNGEEVIVPFADEFVPSVDLEAGRVVVKKPELVE